jgi:hypothetical protein
MLKESFAFWFHVPLYISACGQHHSIARQRASELDNYIICWFWKILGIAFGINGSFLGFV